MAAHRYWRIRVYRNSGDRYTGFTEIEMRGASGGPDLTGSGTALSSTPIQAGSAANVFNGLTNDLIQWDNGGSGAGEWIGYDFGAGNDVEINEIAILPNKDSAGRSAYDFVVQYSDDGSTWTNDDWYCSIDSVWVVGTWKTFLRPAATDAVRYWRVRGITLGSGGTMSCGEMEMRSSPGGADETTATPGQAYARTNFSSSFNADKAFDNSLTTLWSGSGGIMPAEFLRYDFGAGNEKAIREIWWRARHDGDSGQNPTSGVVESSTDGTSFRNRWSFTASGWAAGAEKTFTDPAFVATPRRRQAVVC